RRDSWNREHDCNGECATANTAASRTNENKADRMRWPPSSSSTKGAEIKRTAPAMRSCTVEKHRNPSRSSIGLIECLDCAVSFIQFPATVHSNAQLAGAQRQKRPDRTRHTTAFDFSGVLGRSTWF